jgi:hypothetical protein
MCNGQLPFETEQEILDYNLKMKTTVSDEYKVLLFDCLKPDPDQRPKLADLLNYAWFHVNSAQNADSAAADSPVAAEASPQSSLPTVVSAQNVNTSSFSSAVINPIEDNNC